jgi:hypothetical protein
MIERYIAVASNHILCGRGNCKYNCEGNKVFRRIIHNHLSLYIRSTRSKKTQLIKRVTEELRILGMIFMTVSDDGETLEELSLSEARKKVAHRFRDAVRTANHFDTDKMRKDFTTEITSAYQQASGEDHSLSIDCTIISNSESMNMKGTVAMSKDLENEEMRQKANFTSSLAEELELQTEIKSDVSWGAQVVFHAVSPTDLISEETMFLWQHTEAPFHLLLEF